MQIFVSEYVCGGAWPDEQLNSSLAREGQAMLTALVEDLAKIPGVRVVTTWDARLNDRPTWDHVQVNSIAEEKVAFQKFVRESDCAWIIAPETDRCLEQRVSLFEAEIARSDSNSKCELIGSRGFAIKVCSDKLVLNNLLGFRKIAMPETALFDPRSPLLKNWRFPLWPVVIKPRDGAGSQNTFFVQTKEDLQRVRTELHHVTRPDAFIRQAYIPGKALSVALLIAADGTVREVLPVAEQHLRDDGCFQYLGGRIPADIPVETALAVQQLATHACQVVGATGYVGCDIVLTDFNHDFKPFDRVALSQVKLRRSLPQGQPVLIEINPRLTTSYLGYRLLTDDNIAARLIDPSAPPLRWKSEAVTFTV
jgi:predicted ATP-grasp superfamily ATP-dependent carboligase